MNLKTDLTEPECIKYRQSCNFTNEERNIFDLRVKGRSIVEISQRLNLSEATISRRLHNIKRKIQHIGG